MQKYEILSICGEGFYGTVFRSRVKGTKRVVAIKQFKGSEDYATKREIEVLSRLRHPNIIRLVEVLRPKGKLHMVFEFLDNDLLNILSKEYKQGMPEKMVRSYIQQLCRGLEYCHSRNIIHRDIKPENCLISGDHRRIGDGKLKLCDFGEARVVHAGDKKLSAIIGTRWYRAPEILNGAKTQSSQTGSNASDLGSIKKIVRPKLLEYSNVSDLWGVGCIMGELFIGTPMFPGETDLQQLAIVQKFSTAPQLQKRMEQKSVSAGGMSLLTGLLTLSPAKRLTATAALTHPYYTDDNDSNDHKVNKVSGLGDIAEEVGDDDDSFDGDFSDVEDSQPATNDDDSFDDDDDYTDDDGFDGEDDSERPDSPVLAVYKAVQTTITEPKSTRSHKEMTQETASQKSHRSKHKRRKRHRDKSKGKHKPKESSANTVVEQSSSKHQKKKHRHRKEHEKQKSKHIKSRHRKKDSEDVAKRDGTRSKGSHRHQRKREVPSYARATTAASARSRRSRSKDRAHKDKKRSKKKGKHKSKSVKR